MKKLSIAGLIVLVILATLISGCLNENYKATGGGWFISEPESTYPGDKVILGFNVNFDPDTDTIKGQMQLTDLNTKQKVHVEEMRTYEGIADIDIGAAMFEGYDKEGKRVIIFVGDGGEPAINDYIKVWYDLPIPDDEYPIPPDPGTWSGPIKGGNIQTHAD